MHKKRVAIGLAKLDSLMHSYLDENGVIVLKKGIVSKLRTNIACSNSRPWALTAARHLMLALYIREWLRVFSMFNNNTIHRPATDTRKGSARRGLKNLTISYVNRLERSPTTAPLASIRASPGTTPVTTQEEERYENSVKEPING